MERTALCGRIWFCGDLGDSGETAEGLERTSSRDSRTAEQGTSINSHTFTISFSHSLTHEDDDEDGRRMSSSVAFFYSKETETERARAPRTIRDSLTRCHRLHLTLSLS